MNKPAGVVSTAREPGERLAVVELVESKARLYPVGRLDADDATCHLVHGLKSSLGALNAIALLELVMSPL